MPPCDTAPVFGGKSRSLKCDSKSITRMSNKKPLSVGAVRGMTATGFGVLIVIFGWATGYFDGPGFEVKIEPAPAEVFERRNLDEIGCAEEEHAPAAGGGEPDSAQTANTPQQNRNLAITHWNAGVTARSFGELTTAEENWAKAIEIDPALTEDIQPHLDAVRTEILARANYLLKSTSHFDLRFDPYDSGMTARVPEIEAALDQAFDEVAALWGLHPHQRTEVLILRRGESDAAAWAAGIYDGRIRLIFGDETPATTLRRTMKHEHTHAAFHRLGIQLPTWLNEGCAEISAGASLARTRAYLADALASGQRLPAPSELDTRWVGWTDADRVRMAYAYSTSFVAWLQNKFGESSPRLLFERIPSQGLETAVLATFGQGLSALEAEHRAWLKEFSRVR